MKKFSSITRVNSHRISQNRKLLRIAVVAMVCLLFLMVLPSLFNGVAAMVVAPVQNMKNWLVHSGASLPQYLRNRTELLKELEQLQSEIAEMSGDRFTSAGLMKENAELRSLLNNKPHERILAGVIGRPEVLPYDSLMIDRGTVDGVRNDAPVYIGNNTVIGVVKNATAHTALIELATSPGFETTVYILGPDIYTNAVGVGGGQMRVGVPQGINIQQGDIVVFPSVSSGVYGLISTVQSEASSPEQYGYVSPEIPMASIRYVAVGTSPLQNLTFEEAQAILDENLSTVLTVPVPDNILIETASGTALTPETHEE